MRSASRRSCACCAASRPWRRSTPTARRNRRADEAAAGGPDRRGEDGDWGTPKESDHGAPLPLRGARAGAGRTRSLRMAATVILPRRRARRRVAVGVSRWRCRRSRAAGGAAADIAVIATAPRMRGAQSSTGCRRCARCWSRNRSGATLGEAEAFVAECARRRLPVQVNLWRRAESCSGGSPAGQLADRIGLRPGHVWRLRQRSSQQRHAHHRLRAHARRRGRCGAHVLARAWFLRSDRRRRAGAVLGEPGVRRRRRCFSPSISLSYRENALDVWGDKRPAQDFQEGLLVQHFRASTTAR